MKTALNHILTFIKSLFTPRAINCRRCGMCHNACALLGNDRRFVRKWED